MFTSASDFRPVLAQFRAARELTRRAKVIKLQALVLPSPFGVFKKSYAQVATSVRPPVVRPISGELKLGRYRPHRLMGRYSDEEKNVVTAKAGGAGLSVNEFIRALTLGENYTPPRDPELVKALHKLNRELTYQGNNINQIAHKRNTNLIDESQTDSMLGIIARDYLQTHRAVRKALAQGEGEHSPL